MISRQTSRLALALLMASSTLIGCGANPTMIKHPDQIPDDRGIAFGRVHVFQGDSDVTGSCYLEFEDEKEQPTGTYSLEKDGWVFAALPKKRNQVRLVRCAVMFGLFHGPRDLYFDVPEGQESAYLGDIEFHLQIKDVDAVAGVEGSTTLEGGLVQMSVAQGTFAVRGKDEVMLANNKLDNAVAEYAKRFGKQPQVAIPAAD